MPEKLWKFIDNFGSFESESADKIKSLYFPLANERLMSSVSPDLHGDIKTGQNSFLLSPVSRIDLVNLKSSRNFWIYIDRDKVWSATGVSKDFKRIQDDCFHLKAGLLWQEISRENKDIGLKAEILSFVPAGNDPVEIMRAKITNVSSKRINFFPTAAIPIYARGANNLRDHRHVTSLLQRVTLHKFGVIVKPTLVFDESGHKANKSIYFVLGWDQNSRPPEYLYPTQEMFCHESGDLEAPGSILKNELPQEKLIQGREAMGALRFADTVLTPGQTKTYIIVMGIVESKREIKNYINKFKSLKQVENSLGRTKDFWITHAKQLDLSTGDPDFENWFRWVSIQPFLRKFFGCSFLPDFDYGKGGRGWRDLWQDCLGLIYNNPHQVKGLLINNFRGVRIDGSNATIIGKKEGEFTSDRNNISRVWMDHGIWPLLTLDSYLQETGDFKILFEEVAYFRNRELNRASELDPGWDVSYGQRLKTSSGKIYTGTILEHLLVQNLVQFFNVGKRNHIRLEGADWNDGLDMADKNGESVTFSAMYAYNLGLLSDLLLKIGRPKIKVARELKLLFGKINYNDAKAKNKILKNYFNKTKFMVSGAKSQIDCVWLSRDLKMKSIWIREHIRKREWLKEGFFNGYYDNRGERVEGKKNNLTKMILTSQVFAIMSSVAKEWQVEKILKNIEKYLFDRKLKGIHLNTDFQEEQYNLGRAFSFAYGEKENGAFFNHMVVMLSFALYKRGFKMEGWRVLNSIYNMAMDTQRSKIYPCLPEYFNLEGRGMYSYLTGSASWYVLTLLTQVFGVRGQNGDLLIEPKLCREQFKNTSVISINRSFAGRAFCIKFSNPKRIISDSYKIVRVSLNLQNLPLTENCRVIIPRRRILSLPAGKINKIDIILT
ncbi:MAG: cellobiose phosphorylase [Candidatus Omnitrophica bacterium]|nr:cellobiose phosphorylase [Candidatus Omnitrophota bacterium]MDD5238332.1 cellobiose phosphorylase [Candidatus Omnitrophota bacterium]